MGFWDLLSNALTAVGTEAAVTVALATRSDQDLLDMFDELENYFFSRSEEDMKDEEYEQNVTLKNSVARVLQTRGYFPKTIYIKKESE